MPVLVLSRAFLLIGDSLALRKVSQFTRIAPSQGNVRFLSGSGSLTLASVGLKSEVKTVSANEKNKLQQGVSTIEVPKRREQKRVSGSKTGLVREKNPVDIKTAPFAAESFSELGLPPLLVERLENQGFTVPTDVQDAAVPTVLENHDVVIQSYTGSGKTLAYLLPILSRVGPLRRETLNGYETGNKIDIEAVIVAPSRELGMQIVREVEKLLGPANKKLVQQLVGGANRSRQEEALRKNKPAIVVGTPGRIAEISAAGSFLPMVVVTWYWMKLISSLLSVSGRT